MIEQEVPLLSLISALSMPELGARKQDIYGMTLTKLDAYLSVLADEAKRPAALAMRARLTDWTSPDLTEEISAAAQTMLIAEGYGEQRDNLRRGFAWCEVITKIHELAHPESHKKLFEHTAEVLAKLDAYLVFVTEENKRAAGLAMRAALITWTTPERPQAVTEAARGMLVAEDYANFHTQLLDLVSFPGSPHE